MSLQDNGLIDLLNAVRRLLGGRTPEEEAAAKKDLEEAAKRVEENKGRNGGTYDPSEPLIETVTGIPAELQNNLMLFGVIGVILILILKD